MRRQILPSKPMSCWMCEYSHAQYGTKSDIGSKADSNRTEVKLTSDFKDEGLTFLQTII